VPVLRQGKSQIISPRKHYGIHGRWKSERVAAPNRNNNFRKGSERHHDVEQQDVANQTHLVRRESLPGVGVPAVQMETNRSAISSASCEDAEMRSSFGQGPEQTAKNPGAQRSRVGDA
jgi:hypothetical protein